MPRLAHAFTNFTAGELSPRLDGRIDLAKYQNGVTNLENFLVHPHGGVTRRPGTEFIAEVKSSSLPTRIIPFEFNTEQVYLIEAGNQYLRFYKDGGQILNSGSIVEVATPYLTAELFEIKYAQSADTMFIVHPNHAPRKLTRTSDTAWTLTEVPFEFGPFLDENTTDTTITSSARTGTVTLTASADLFVSTDVGRLVKIYDGFAKISAFTNATTVAAVVQPNLDGLSELLPEYTATTISFSEGDPSSTGAEHNDRIVDSAKLFKDQGFVVGQKITISGASSTNNGDKLIAEVTDDTILTAPSDDLADQAAGSSFTIVGKLEATDEWSLGAFSTTTGFPGAICFFEERLVYGGTTSQPQTVFFSESGGFDQFNTGADDADAMVFTLASSQVNVIRSLVPSRTLIVLTTGAEFSAGSGSNLDPITPTNIQIKRQTTHGTANVAPVTAGSAVLFLQRAKRKIRELQYNFDVDGFVAPDMTILSEHISEGGFVELAVQQEPDNIIWAVRADGQLCGLTYRREEQVVAWHRHIIAGISGAATITVTDFANIATGTTLKITKSDGTLLTFTSEAAGSSSPASALGFRPNSSNNTTADNIFTMLNSHADLTVANPAANVVTVKETTRAGTGFLSIESSDTTRLATTNQANALVESVAVLPGDLNEDEVYVVVNRTINGSTERYIERLSNIDFGTSANDAFYVDSGLTYSGAAATTISGLTHLEGESVTVLANGAAHANKTVSSGAITLDRSATKAQIGLGYTSQLRTMRIEGGSAQGTSQGAIKRIHDVTFRFFRTVGAKVGSSATNHDSIPFRSSADEMGESLDLFTGDKTIEFPNGYDTDAHVFVKQEQPLPMTVIGIYARMEVFDR
jgi:hypothetical protein